MNTMLLMLLHYLTYHLGPAYRSEMAWRCDADMRKELLIILDEKINSG